MFTRLRKAAVVISVVALLAGCPGGLELPTGSIHGVVTHAGVTGVAGTSVYLDGTSYQAWVASSGEFTLTYVPAGTYTVVIHHEGFETVRVSDVVVENEVTTELEPVDLVFADTSVGLVTGRATLDGTPTGNSGIAVSLEGTAISVETDDEGYYTLDSVPAPATYTLQAGKFGYGDVSMSIGVVGGQSVVVPQFDMGEAIFEPVLSAFVDGTPVQPGDTLVFPETQYARASEVTVTISNQEGTADLTLDEPSGGYISGTAPDIFSVVQEADAVVQPGQQTTVVVQALSAVAGTFDGILTLATNDPDVANLVLSLRATIVAPSEFSVVLGSVTAIPEDLVSGSSSSDDFYLEMSVDGDTLSPRVQLGSMSFAQPLTGEDFTVLRAFVPNAWRGTDSSSIVDPAALDFTGQLFIDDTWVFSPQSFAAQVTLYDELAGGSAASSHSLTADIHTVLRFRDALGVSVPEGFWSGSGNYRLGVSLDGQPELSPTALFFRPNQNVYGGNVRVEGLFIPMPCSEAAGNYEIHVGGRLINTSLEPVTGVLEVGFSLYNAQSDGTEVYSTMATVAFSDGWFSFSPTDTQALWEFTSGEVNDYWAEIEIGGDTLTADEGRIQLNRPQPGALVTGFQELAVLAHKTDPGLHAVGAAGEVVDSAGNPVSGPHSLRFSIFDADSGGSVLWQETVDIQF